MDVDFVFCKQKTAYEMRISDWSSDVCSSDLNALPLPLAPMRGAMNVLTGDFILAADGLHGLANSAPSITAIAPAAWLVPQDTLHSIAGQQVTLLGGHVPKAGQVLSFRAETRRLAVGRSRQPFKSTFKTREQK